MKLNKDWLHIQKNITDPNSWLGN